MGVCAVNLITGGFVYAIGKRNREASKRDETSLE